MNFKAITERFKQGRIAENLDRDIALVGLAIGLALISWSVLGSGEFLGTGARAVIACLGYLAIRRHLPSSGIAALEKLRTNSSTYLILNILFPHHFRDTTFSKRTSANSRG